MLEKIEVGKTYLNTFNKKVKVLFKNDEITLWKSSHDNLHGHVSTDFALKNWSELPVKKVKAYLYCDEDGEPTQFFYTDDGRCWDGSKLHNSCIGDSWIKTNTFIPVNDK